MQLSDLAFDTISSIAMKESGLHLPDSKRAFVYSRLQKRIRKLNLGSFDRYCEVLKGSSSESENEKIVLISLLTTNVTQFFREPHHFELLREKLLPEIQKRAAAGHKIRLWSAGCSSGHEPYSMLLACLKEAPNLASADFKILASDIDSNILLEGIRASYDYESIPPAYLDIFSPFINRTSEKAFSFKDEVRRLISFRKLNLLQDWPFSGKFDAIFCRNVAIYFEPETQKKLFVRLSGALQPHGWLFIGHSERAPTNDQTKLISSGLTSYCLSELKE